MARRTTLVAAAILMLASVAMAGDKPNPTVKFAKNWKAAVEEAKTLNVPIVVHSHGFY